MLHCSHVLCKVASVQEAVDDFTGAGFSVTWGSAPERAHNALIWFDSGPFIELFELPSWFRFLWAPMAVARGRRAAGRLTHWAAAPQGWCDVALETDETDLAPTHHLLRERGVAVSRVMDGARTRPDGQRVRYQFLAPTPPALPFVVSAYDPPQRPASTRHPNGASEITRVEFGLAAADRPAFDLMAGRDRVLHPVDGPAGVRSVEVAGLTGAPDPRQVRGAVFAVPRG